VLFMLVAVDKLNGISVLPAVVILLREVLVSGLREFLAGIRVGMPVSKLAKWKTAIQMVALGILIVGKDGPPWLPVEAIGVVGLWAAGLLTLITGWDYMQAGWKHMNEEREPEPEPTPRPAQPHGTGAARSVG
jgi:cardiolipin synthase (CMP-forming)